MSSSDGKSGNVCRLKRSYSGLSLPSLKDSIESAMTTYPEPRLSGRRTPLTSTGSPASKCRAPRSRTEANMKNSCPLPSETPTLTSVPPSARSLRMPKRPEISTAHFHLGFGMGIALRGLLKTETCGRMPFPRIGSVGHLPRGFIQRRVEFRVQCLRGRPTSDPF